MPGCGHSTQILSPTVPGTVKDWWSKGNQSENDYWVYYPVRPSQHDGRADNAEFTAATSEPFRYRRLFRWHSEA